MDKSQIDLNVLKILKCLSKNPNLQIFNIQDTQQNNMQQDEEQNNQQSQYNQNQNNMANDLQYKESELFQNGWNNDDDDKNEKPDDIEDICQGNINNNNDINETAQNQANQVDAVEGIQEDNQGEQQKLQDDMKQWDDVQFNQNINLDEYNDNDNKNNRDNKEKDQDVNTNNYQIKIFNEQNQQQSMDTENYQNNNMINNDNKDIEMQDMGGNIGAYPDAQKQQDNENKDDYFEQTMNQRFDNYNNTNEKVVNTTGNDLFQDNSSKKTQNINFDNNQNDNDNNNFLLQDYPDIAIQLSKLLWDIIVYENNNNNHQQKQQAVDYLVEILSEKQKKYQYQYLKLSIEAIQNNQSVQYQLSFIKGILNSGSIIYDDIENKYYFNKYSVLDLLEQQLQFSLKFTTSILQNKNQFILKKNNNIEEYLQDLQQKLDFLQTVWDKAQYIIDIEIIELLWEILYVNAISPLETQKLFQFFRKVLVKEFYTSIRIINKETQNKIFYKYLINLTPENYQKIEDAFQCFQDYFILINTEINYLQPYEINLYSTQQQMQIYRENLIGIEKIWQLYFKGSEQISKKSSELLLQIIDYRPSDDEISNRLKIRFIEYLMENIKENIEIESNDQKNKNQSIERSIDLFLQLFKSMDSKLQKQKQLNDLGESFSINVEVKINGITSEKKFQLKVYQKQIIKDLIQQINSKITPQQNVEEIELFTSGKMIKYNDKRTLQEAKMKEGTNIQCSQTSSVFDLEENKNDSDINFLTDEDITNRAKELKQILEQYDINLLKYALYKNNNNFDSTLNIFFDDELVIAGYQEQLQKLLDDNNQQSNNNNKDNKQEVKNENEFYNEGDLEQQQQKQVFNILSNQDQYFELFFQVLQLEDNKLSSKVWELLEILPKNQHIFENIKQLKNLNEQEQLELINNDNPYKLLYVLQQMKQFIKCTKINQEFQDLIMERKQWKLEFAQKLFQKLYSQLLESNKENINNQKLLNHLIYICKVYLHAYLISSNQNNNEAMKRLNLAINYRNFQEEQQKNNNNSFKSGNNKDESKSQISSDIDKNTPAFNSPISSTSRSTSPNQITGQQNNLEIEANKSEFSLGKGQNNEDQIEIENKNEQEVMVIEHDEFNDIIQYMQNNNEFKNMFDEIFNLELLLQQMIEIIIMNSQKLQEDQDQKFNTIIENSFDIILPIISAKPHTIQILYSQKDFEKALLNILQNSKSDNLRKNTSLGILSICHFMPHIDKEDEIYINSEQIQLITAKKYFLTMFLKEIKQIQHIENEDFFICFSSLISQIESNELKKIMDIEQIIDNLADEIIKRPIYEKRYENNTDKVLGGQMILLASLISLINNDLKKQLNNKYKLIKNVYDFLFYIPEIRKQSQDIENEEQVIENEDLNYDLPKCKQNSTRKKAFDILLEICRDCPENTIELLGKVKQNHEKVENLEIDMNVDVKPNHGYAGLKNYGSTCYINSLLQQLFMIKDLRNGLLNSQIVKQSENDENINYEDHTLYQTQYLFGNLIENIKSYIQPIDLINSVKDMDGQKIDVRIQQDVNEFFNRITDKIENDLKKTEQKNILQDLIGGKFSHEIISLEKDCPYYGEREEPFLSLSLEIKNKKNIQEALDTFIQDDILEGENKYFCEDYNKKIKVKKRCTIKTLPNNLFITLKRFEYDFTTWERKKINDYFEFPLNINLESWTTQFKQKQEKNQKNEENQEEKNSSQKNEEDEIEIEENKNQQKNNQEQGQEEEMEIEENKKSQQQQLQLNDYPQSYYEYTLTGVLVHSGTADFGHYYSYIKDNKFEKSNDWYEFNDQYVRSFDVSKLDQETFGGDLEKQNKFTSFYDDDQDNNKKQRNAYILIYQRKEKLPTPSDKFCQSVIPKDIHQQIIQQNLIYLKQKMFNDPIYFSFTKEFIQLCKFKGLQEVKDTISYSQEDFKEVEYYHKTTKPLIDIQESYDDQLDSLEENQDQYQPELDFESSLEYYLQQPELQQIKLATIFSYDLYLKTKDIQQFQELINYLYIQYKRYLPANFWIIDYFVNNKNLLFEIFLENNSTEFKSSFGKLLMQAIKEVYQVEESYIHAQETIKVAKNSNNQDNFAQFEEKNINKSCILRLFFALVDDLKSECQKYFYKASEYFKIIGLIVKCSPYLAKYLCNGDYDSILNNHFLSMFMEKVKWKINYNQMSQYEYSDKDSLISLLNLIITIVRQLKTEGMIKADQHSPTSLNNFPLQELGSITQRNSGLVLRENVFIEKMFIFYPQTQEPFNFLIHVCWNNMLQTQSYLKALVKQSRAQLNISNSCSQLSFEEIKNLFKVIFKLINMDGDTQSNKMDKIEFVFNVSEMNNTYHKGSDLITALQYSKTQDIQYVIQVLYVILDQSKKNPELYNYIQQNPKKFLWVYQEKDKLFELEKDSYQNEIDLITQQIDKIYSGLVEEQIKQQQIQIQQQIQKQQNEQEKEIKESSDENQDNTDNDEEQKLQKLNEIEEQNNLDKIQEYKDQIKNEDIDKDIIEDVNKSDSDNDFDNARIIDSDDEYKKIQQQQQQVRESCGKGLKFYKKL